MTYTLHTIQPEGEVLSSTQTAAPSLQALQDIVGGYIQTVPRFNTYKGSRCIVYVNEEGRMQNLPFNQTATDLWLEQDELIAQPLVGNVVVICADQHLLDKL